MVSGAWLNKRFFAGQEWGNVTWAKIGRWSADCIISDGLSGWNLRMGCPFPVRCLGRRHALASTNFYFTMVHIDTWLMLFRVLQEAEGRCCAEHFFHFRRLHLNSQPAVLQEGKDCSDDIKLLAMKLHIYLPTHPFPSMCPASVAKKVWL